MDIPPILKSLKPYLAHAQQIGKHDPAVAYYCRYYAVLLGIEINKTASPEDKKLIGATLGSLLDKLEAEKAKIKDQLVSGGKEKVQDLATKIFDQADLEDREGNATKITARNFYAASIFITASKQFYPDQKLDEAWEEKLRYAKWKAADITNAIKEGRTPTPGSASEQSDLNSLLSGESLPGGPSAPQFETAASVASASLSSADPLAALAALSVPTTTVQAFPPPPANTPASNGSNNGAINFNASWPSAPQGFPDASHFPDPNVYPPSNPSANFNVNPGFPPANSSVAPKHTEQPPPKQPPPPSKQPPPPQHTTAPPARSNSTITAPALSYDSLGVNPDSIDRASKHARYAQSALQFEDVGTAVKHLRQALQELGYQ